MYWMSAVNVANSNPLHTKWNELKAKWFFYETTLNDPYLLLLNGQLKTILTALM
jgi:hypothetical protein